MKKIIATLLLALGLTITGVPAHAVGNDDPPTDDRDCAQLLTDMTADRDFWRYSSGVNTAEIAEARAETEQWKTMHASEYQARVDAQEMARYWAGQSVAKDVRLARKQATIDRLRAKLAAR
jgi:hypothetical protein